MRDYRRVRKNSRGTMISGLPASPLPYSWSQSVSPLITVSVPDQCQNGVTDNPELTAHLSSPQIPARSCPPPSGVTARGNSDSELAQDSIASSRRGGQPATVLRLSALMAESMLPDFSDWVRCIRWGTAGAEWVVSYIKVHRGQCSEKNITEKNISYRFPLVIPGPHRGSSSRLGIGQELYALA